MSCRRMNSFLTSRQTFPENKRAHLSLLICDGAICYIFLHKTLPVCWKFTCSLFSPFVAIFRKKKETISRAHPRLSARTLVPFAAKWIFAPIVHCWRVVHEKWPSWRIDGRVRSVISVFLLGTIHKNSRNGCCITSCCCKHIFSYFIDSIDE